MLNAECQNTSPHEHPPLILVLLFLYRMHPIVVGEMEYLIPDPIHAHCFCGHRKNLLDYRM